MGKVSRLSKTLILLSIQQVITEQSLLTQSHIKFKVSQVIQYAHRQLRCAKKLKPSALMTIQYSPSLPSAGDKTLSRHVNIFFLLNYTT